MSNYEDFLESRVNYLFDLYGCLHTEGHKDRIESIECHIKELLKEVKHWKHIAYINGKELETTHDENERLVIEVSVLKHSLNSLKGTRAGSLQGYQPINDGNNVKNPPKEA